MEILQGFVDAVVGIFNSSGLTTLNWQNYVMIGISIVLLYLAIKKQYEPLLLLPIAFGMLLVNLYPSIMSAPSTEMIPLADYVKDHTGAIQYPITELNGAEYVNYRQTAVCFGISIRVLSLVFTHRLSSLVLVV